MVGFYFAAYLALPLCNWLYARLEPVLGRSWLARRRSAAETTADMLPPPPGEHRPGAGDSLLAWLLIAAGIVISNRLAAQVPVAQTLPGVAVMLAIVVLVALARRLLPRLPLMLTLAVVSTLVSVPGLWVLSSPIAAVTDRVRFMSIPTTVLALAGFSVVHTLPAFRRLGWRIVVVSLTATAGTFLGAALIAEFFHRA